MNFSDEHRLHCLAQHFAVWFEDIKNDRLPDFGLPCQGCKNQKVCHELGYPWLDILGPVLDYPGVHLDLSRKENTE